MTQQFIVDFAMDSIKTTLLLSAPMLGFGLITGLAVSIFQAVTQIQEQTLSFAVKLIAVSVTILLMANWLGGEIYNYGLNLFDSFPILVK